MVVVHDPIDMSLRDRSLIVAGVALVHISLLWFWVSLPDLPKPLHQEMSVSVILPSPPQPAPQPAQVEPKPEPKPAVKPKPVEPQRVQPAPQAVTDMPVVKPVEMPQPPAPTQSSAPAQPVAAPPSLPDREPDYQASYLNNPVPAYPMVARRMGWQGRVVLNVEVLASGLPGQIKLHQSSGYDALDNAALQAVRGWRFVAARQGGQASTKWFLVPIPFILKED
jgi:protein TonB